MDSNQFVSQLAQFGTVSGIQSMQTSLAIAHLAMLSTPGPLERQPGGHSVLTSATAANLSASRWRRSAAPSPSQPVPTS